MSFEPDVACPDNRFQRPMKALQEIDGRPQRSIFAHDQNACNKEIAMNLELNQDGLCLKSNQVLKVRGGSGHTIICHSGSVWVTQDRDRRDIVLGAGESFALDRNGLTLVQAFEQSAISIAPAAVRDRAAVPAARPGHATAAAGLPRAAAGI
jgi:hypothetical protein